MNTHEHAATVTICTNAEHIRSHVLDLACRNLTGEDRAFLNATDGLVAYSVEPIVRSLVETYIACVGKVIYNAGDDLGVDIDDRTHRNLNDWTGGRWVGFYHIVSGIIAARKLATDAIVEAETNLARMLGNYALGMIEEERAFRAKEAM
jgi:hypothetical protein